MTRRRTNPKFDEHLSGVRANFDTDCDRCGGAILVGMRVVRRGDSWMHIQCASGFSDE